jgi:hypothetical protein
LVIESTVVDQRMSPPTPRGKIDRRESDVGNGGFNNTRISGWWPGAARDNQRFVTVGMAAKDNALEAVASKASGISVDAMTRCRKLLNGVAEQRFID